MKLLFTILVSILFGQLYKAQALVQKNEAVLYSFTTKNKKQVVIVKNSSDNKVYYRFGSKNNSEFQFPPVKNDPSQKLTYSFYLRGGGENNEGMDLNYIYFVNDHFQYVIYDTYYSVGNKQSVGIKVKDLKTQKTTDIQGDPKTRKGSLTDFRDNHLLEIGEELFD